MNSPYDFTSEQVICFMLILCRIGGTIGFLPALGNQILLQRAKILLTVAISLCIYPLVINLLPDYKNLGLIFCVVTETLIGIFIGLVYRIIFESVQILGEFIALQSGINSAAIFDITQASQSPVISAFVRMVAVLMIFSTDTHHIFISSIIESYNAVNLPLISDMSELITQSVSKSMLIALKIASPFIILNMAIQVAGGLLSRLIPSLQIFYIITPFTILITFVIILFSLMPILKLLIHSVQNALT